MILLLPLVAIAFISSAHSMDVVAITDEKSVKDFSCLNGTTSRYNSIDLPEQVLKSDHIELRVCSSMIMRRNITFTKVNHLTVVGYGSPTIKCYSSPMLIAVEVLNLKLVNLTFDNCVFVLTSPIDFTSIHSAEIKRLFTQHNGSSLCILNVKIETSLGGIVNTPDGNQQNIMQNRYRRFLTSMQIDKVVKPEPLLSMIIHSTATFRHESVLLLSRSNISSCPPGFVYNNSTGCTLSPSQYLGISMCPHNVTNREACWSGGYWIGYNKNEMESEDTLLFGYCPPTFCSSKYHHLLPRIANREDLNLIICSDSHTSTLCGRCKPGFSVYYHSLDFKCKVNKLCKWGWLFFVLSEIVPVSLIFIAIIGFNISFTSGLLNGFIFFCQVVEMFQLTARGFIPLSNTANLLHRIHYLIFLCFNLDTFVLDEISYCIWKGANALDILAFSYVTMVYAFIFIASLIFCINRCTNRCTLRRLPSSQWMKFQSNIIHGLSALLVLFFAHSVRASILLLSPTKIYSKGMKFNKNVVTYDGEIQFLSTQHLPYAIPAIVILLLASMPPILLLVYPLHYKILAALGVAETRYVNIALRPLERIRPFMDSFQGCFKDNCRFFSGLYFVYRFLFLINMINLKLEDTYFYITLQLLVMLILHALCQPYKKRLHNIFDGLLFGNLAMINALTSYNFSIISGKEETPNISVPIWIQIVLVFLPLLVLIVCVLIKCLLLCSSHKHCHSIASMPSVKQFEHGKCNENSSEHDVCLSYGSLDRSASTY